MWELSYLVSKANNSLLGFHYCAKHGHMDLWITLLISDIVHKLGSFGRSLDISKFSSYNELRCELARMFGLEGQLEDPQRSGWQLVFVDRENDILLLGDDPWQ
ncbi:hypothetical protein Gotri_007644 [Gossypium trilobum]|uniref:PB1 domain-containing protein n=1 Tax=Gossypium trilobum TaxID=34281 RepID=A0A7J9EGR6_9ROSI|nr:hypothetical protein [Gossypium trilobum]